MFRWYDYWLKGIDNGVDGRARRQRLRRGLPRGGHRRRSGRRRTSSTGRCTCARAASSRAEPEPMGPEHAAPDGFYQAPLTVTDKVEILSWSTDAVRGGHRADRHRRRAPVRRDRPAGHQLHPAAVGRRPERQPPAASPPASSRPRTASSTTRTTEGNPYHPHTRAVPVEPGTIEEYVAAPLPVRDHVPARATAWWSELSNDEPLADEHNALLPPDAFHLPGGPAGHAQDLPRRRAPVAARAAVHRVRRTRLRREHADPPQRLPPR